MGRLMIRFGRIDKKNSIGLFVKGHANSEKEATAPNGQNMVCAAVSAISLTACVACQKHSWVKYEEKKGELRFTADKIPATTALVEGALDGLEMIKKQYPNSFEE